MDSISIFEIRDVWVSRRHDLNTVTLGQWCQTMFIRQLVRSTTGLTLQTISLKRCFSMVSSWYIKYFGEDSCRVMDWSFPERGKYHKPTEFSLLSCCNVGCRYPFRISKSSNTSCLGTKLYIRMCIAHMLSNTFLCVGIPAQSYIQ